MLNITKVNNSIKVEGLDNKQFPDNGTLMIPLNSVILTLDESNIATFRSAANNDVLFSGVITDIQINGSTVTKQTITTAFTAVANAASGGGGGTVDAYTKAETDALLATKANESELSDYATVESLATVAMSGDYNDLSNKPTIPVVPTDVSAFNNDAGYITQEEVIINEAFPNSWHTTGTMADLIADINADTDAVAGKVYMDTVSFSDLPGEMQQAELKAEIISQLGDSKVIVFTVTSSEVSPYHWEYTSAYGQTNSWREWVTPAAMQSALSVKANSADLATVATSGDYTDLSNTPNLATVATTGDYNDLTNKPTIPAAQVQSDWDEADTTSKAYIQNKPSLATVATSGNYSDLNGTPSLATVATSGDYDDLTNKPTIPTVPTNISEFTNDAGYTTNEGTITGITMNSVSKGTSGVVDLGTVITDISGKQDVIDSSHKLNADLVDDTTSTNKFVTASDKSTWSGKQDALVSGTNIKTINNESILGSGNITIQGGGSSYTAGDNINITNDVISVDIDDEKKVIASALVELHNDKADKNQLNNYQLKGNYVEQSAVDASIAAAVANYRTEAEAINVEKVDAAAFNDLDKRVTALETRIAALEARLSS